MFKHRDRIIDGFDGTSVEDSDDAVIDVDIVDAYAANRSDVNRWNGHPRNKTWKTSCRLERGGSQIELLGSSLKLHRFGVFELQNTVDAEMELAILVADANDGRSSALLAASHGTIRARSTYVVGLISRNNKTDSRSRS